ncbi:MAG: hypothetical protein WAT39_13930 [Planctomycetota bacterium]
MQVNPVPRCFLVCALVSALAAPAAAQVLITNGTAPPGEPAGTDFVRVVSKMQHSAAHRADGSVVLWGNNAYGQCNLPPLPPGLSWTQVSTGTSHTMARRSDGAVVGCGRNDSGQSNAPPLPPGVALVAVDASNDWNLGLRSDGRVVVWGGNPGGPLHTTLPTAADFVAIAAGSGHALALRSDGTVVAWGGNYDGQLNTPVLGPGQAYTAIAAGAQFSAALRSDGAAVVWGSPGYGLQNLPALGPGQRWVRLASGYYQVIAWRNDGAVFMAGLAWHWLTPPPANHDYVGVAWGWDHVHWLAAPHVAAGYTSLGPGCPGSAGASMLTATQPPTLGNTFTCQVDHVPQGLAALLSGLDAVNSPFGPLPIDLSFLGMTGCLGRIRTDVTQVAPSTAGIATFALAVPWRSELLGFRFYQQALLPDAAANPAGLVLSEARAAVVGLY